MLSQLSILLIEHDTELAKNYEQLLSTYTGQNFKLLVAHSLTQALGLLEQQDIECILLSSTILTEDKESSLASIHDHKKDQATPIVLLINAEEEKTVNNLLPHGVVDYCVKELLTAERLFNTINLVLDYTNVVKKFVITEPSLPVKQRNQLLRLEWALADAIKHDEFYLEYLPIFSVENKNIIGIEALLRWRSPEFGILLAEDFLPIAERNQSIIQIGAWVLHNACCQFANWYHSGLFDIQLSIAVNVSAQQLLVKQWYEMVSDILQKTQLPPSSLELVVTETALLTAKKVKVMIEFLNQMGIGLAIDDFASGYSSLLRINYLPVKTIKIGLPFIKQLNTSERSAAIVSSLIHLGEKLNINVIAKNIENEQQLKVLEQLGCPYVQGEILSPPLSATEMEELLCEMGIFDGIHHK